MNSRILLIGLAVWLISCESTETETTEYTTTPLTEYEVLVDYESQKLLQPAALVAFDDEVIVVDGGDMRLKAFDEEGNKLRAFGGEGEGPGHFLGVQGLTIQDDDLYFYDRQLDRFAHFSRNGEFVETYPHDFVSRFFSDHTVWNGEFYSTTSGADNALLAAYDKNGDQLNSWGEPVGDVSENDMGSIMSDAFQQGLNEEVPELFKNQGDLAASGEHLWMKMAGSPKLYRLSKDGQWDEFDLQVERKEETKEQYFYASQRMSENDQQALLFFRYARAIYATDEYLYLLHYLDRSDDAAAVYQVNLNGQIENRYKLTELSGRQYRLAVSPDNAHIYILDAMEASLLRYEI